MAAEIQFTDTPSSTDYAVLTNSVGQWYNTAGAAFEAFNASNFTDYDLAATEAGATGFYTASMPSVAAGVYNVQARRRAGGSPAVSDAVVAVGEIEWDGSAVTNPPTLAQFLAGGDVDGFTMEQTLKLILASAAAKLSGAATTSVVIRAADDSKDRISATVDADGNRSAVVLDATG